MNIDPSQVPDELRQMVEETNAAEAKLIAESTDNPADMQVETDAVTPEQSASSEETDANVQDTVKEEKQEHDEAKDNEEIPEAALLQTQIQSLTKRLNDEDGRRGSELSDLKTQLAQTAEVNRTLMEHMQKIQEEKQLERKSKQKEAMFEIDDNVLFKGLDVSESDPELLKAMAQIAKNTMKAVKSKEPLVDEELNKKVAELSKSQKQIGVDTKKRELDETKLSHIEVLYPGARSIDATDPGWTKYLKETADKFGRSLADIAVESFNRGTKKDLAVVANIFKSYAESKEVKGNSKKDKERAIEAQIVPPKAASTSATVPREKKVTLDDLAQFQQDIINKVYANDTEGYLKKSAYFDEALRTGNIGFGEKSRR